MGGRFTERPLQPAGEHVGDAKDWNSAENLATAYTVYNYALALSYNEECVPGQGSAIFLHCFTANPDNGSAAVSAFRRSGPKNW